MSDWQRTLKLSDVWERARNREIAAQELAKIIAERLVLLKEFGNEYVDSKRQELIDEFKLFGEDDGTMDYDDLDYLLSELYDWGDISLDDRFGGKKVCWIKTF